MNRQMDESELTALVLTLVATELKIPASQIDIRAEFTQLGLDSLGAMYILDELEQRMKVEINPLLFWEYPTIQSFSHQLAVTYKSP